MSRAPQSHANGIPKKRKLNAEPIQSLKFQKHEYGKEKKRSVRLQKDVRGPHEQTISDSELKSFYDEVKLVEKKTGKKIGLSFILPHVPLQNNDPEPEAQDPRDSELNRRLVSTEKVHLRRSE